jgi:endoribonuclease Dicer
MIFDECHHARKNNPYNGILREYFQLNPLDRKPKIFGMTASPIWSVKNPLGSLSDLESNMDAKVIAVVEHVQELTEHSPKSKEVRGIFQMCLVFFASGPLTHDTWKVY